MTDEEAYAPSAYVDAKGFKKGNPGRKPISAGGKPNWTTIAKNKISENLPGLVESLLNQALAGDVQAARVLLGKALPDLKAIDVKTDGEGLPRLQIVTTKNQVIEGEIINEKTKPEKLKS